MKKDEVAVKAENPFENYKAPKGEEGHIHVALRKKGIDEETEKPRFKPYVQKYDQQGWRQFLRHFSSQGVIIVKYLHLPKDTPKTRDELPEVIQAAKEAAIKQKAIETAIAKGEIR